MLASSCLLFGGLASAFCPREAGATGTAGPPQDRYLTANDIPASAIENHDLLYGYVERVMDGDTLRVS